MKPPQLIIHNVSNRLVTGERVETIDSRCVGNYATDMSNGEIVFIVWGTLFDKFDSYTIESVIMKRIAERVDRLYVADMETNDLYLFDPDDYLNSETIQWDGRIQFAPKVSEALRHWENGLQELVS